MTTTQSPATSQGRMVTAWMSAISEYLPSVFSRESSSATACAGATNSSCKDKISTVDDSRALVEIQETKRHFPTPAAPELSLCHDIPPHTQPKKRIELTRRVRTMLRKALPDKENCVGCDKQVRTAKLVTAPCGHMYCPRCLCKMAVLALQNMEQFPVRCCSREIPALKIAYVMNARGRRLYMSRADEHAVPPAERWYCPHTTCGQWIPPRYVKANSKTQKCPHCRAVICASCHDLAHENRECAEDPGLGQLLETARRQHWQRCYNCHALVWKIDGCNHMRCRCGSHFCYICGRQWPGCHCRNSTVDLNNGGQMGEGDLDVRTVVAAMEIAEREEAQIIHYEPWEVVLIPRAEQLEQQPQQSVTTNAASNARTSYPADENCEPRDDKTSNTETSQTCTAEPRRLTERSCPESVKQSGVGKA